MSMVRLTRAYVGAVVLLTGVGGALSPARAVDGTWLGGTSTDWNDATNWTSNPSVPDGTATFTSTGLTTVDTSGLVTIGQIAFTAAPNAQAYTIGINDFFLVTGPGVFNNSTNAQTFNVNTPSLIFQNSSTASGGTGVVNYINVGFIFFQNTSTAGGANITNNSILQFFDSSSAGTATITNNVVMDFFDTSDAGTASITNNNTGVLTFNVSSSANTAIITNNGTLNFINASTAGTANISTTSGATLTFNDTSSADNAIITSNASTFQFLGSSTAANSQIHLLQTLLSFQNSSTAGNATIDMPNLLFPGSIEFRNDASAGTANITVIGTTGAGFSQMDFYNSSTAANATITNAPGIGSAGLTLFHDTSTAANATINNNGGTTQFINTSTAGFAIITNNAGFAVFDDQSTAANATIVNNSGGFTQFGLSGIGTDTSTAGNANITNNNGGSTSFNAFTTAGSAIVTTNNGGNVFFFDTSTGGDARFITNTGGTFDMSGLAAAGMTAGSIEGPGSYILGAKTLTVGSNNLSTEVSGIISGLGGSLIKVGTGTLTLSNTSTYTGATTVNGGTLAVNGSIVASSSVTVNSGGILGGTGILPSTIINNGGALSPGNSIGTITVNGNLTFNAGSTYIVEVSPTMADRTNVTGTATLAGTLNAVFQPGSFTTNNYTVLSAAGGRTGTFTLVTTNLPVFLTASLNYTATDVVLMTLTANITQPGTCVSSNQCAVGSALDAAFNAGKGLFPGFGALTLSQVPAALDALSGEIHATILTTLVDDSSFVRSAILGRLLQATYFGGDTTMASLAYGGPLMAHADEPTATVYAYAPRALDAYAADFPVKAPPAARRSNPDLTFWAQAFGAWGRFDSDGNAAAAKRSLGGFISGFDRRFGDWRLGLAGSYTASRVNVDARLSSATIDSAHFAGYLGKTYGAFSLRSGAALSWHEISVNRTAAFPGFSDTLTTTYHGNTVQAFGELGYGMSFGRVAVEPFAGLAFVRVETGGFNELGGAAALTTGSTHYQVGYTSLGVHTATTMTLAGSTAVPHLSLAWQHALSSVTPTMTLAFLGTGAAFNISGVPLARDSALVDTGLDVAIARNTTIGLSYVGQLSGSVQDHAVKGRATVRF